jgi:ribosomal protein L13
LLRAVLFETGVLEGRREMSTFIPSGKNIDRKWFVVDASGKTLGRLATKAADVLSGKLNPQYVPYIDVGDHVIVINAEKVRLTGLKAQSKLYRRYTGFPGGLREESYTRLLQAGNDSGTGHQGHAAQEQDGPPDGYQTEGLSRR